MTEDPSKQLTLFDKIKLYPEIVLDETIHQVRDTLEQLSAKVTSCGKDDDVGLILEDLAKAFLESPYLKFDRARRRCETGEIDLSFTVKRFEATLFYEFSYLLIVECKNLRKKAGAPDLRVFWSKMREVDTNIGIFFSTKGITRDAKGVIRNAWLQDKIVILVFETKDWEQIINGSNNLYEVFRQKYLAVRTASRE